MEFKFFSDSSFTGKLDESMCQSFQVTNSVICQRHSCLFFSCYILFYKKNPLVDLKLKLWPAIHARRGILNVADRSVASFTPSHYLQHYLSMTANAAAVPGLVISATTEYLTNNYHTQTALEFYGRSTRLEAHSHRMVEKETRNQPRSQGISSSCSAPWKRGSRRRPQRLYEGS